MNKDFKVGDYVYVVRKVESFKLPWINSWVPYMDNYINSGFHKIVGIERGGFILNCIPGIDSSLSQYNFPEEALEYINDKISIKELDKLDQLLNEL